MKAHVDRILETSRCKRREVITLTFAASLAAVLSLGVCASREYKPAISAYLPIWHANEKYDRIGRQLKGSARHVNRLYLAFAVPEASDNMVEMPEIPAGVERLIAAMPHSDLAVSLGGAGVSEEAWESAYEYRTIFGESVERLRAGLEARFRREVHIDLDCEAGISSPRMTGLAQAIRQALHPERQLSMAVFASNQGRYDMGPGGLPHIVDTFRVMTYDQFGPWSNEAGPIASGPWTLSAIDRWVKEAGSASKVEAGFPAYGYVYPGAQKAGDQFSPSARSGDALIMYTDLPSGPVYDDTGTLTSYTMLHGNWASVLSPFMIEQIHSEMLRRHPGLGGSFFWPMEGMTQAHIQAVR